jgi:arylsulfatase A-like enzyme
VKSKEFILGMNIYTWIHIYIVLACLILGSIGCSPPADDFDASVDILAVTRAKIQENTNEIRLKRTGYVHPALFHGWDRSRETDFQASALEGRVSFNCLTKPEDIVFTFTAEAPPALRDNRQNIILSLNGSIIHEIELESGQSRDFTLRLPESKLRLGKNSIDFRFSHIPHSRGKGGAYAAVFKTMTLRHAVSAGPEGKVLQYGQSDFSYFAELPEKFRLTAAYQNMRGTRTAIEFWRSDQKIESFDLDPDKTQWKKTISLSASGRTIIKFINRGREDSLVVWDEIVLNKKDLKPPQEEQNRSPSVRPHILIYVVDTLRADHLSCYGYSRRTSPELDQFAEESAVYTSAYANTPWTRPSGASILTGLYPKNHKTTGRFGKLGQNLSTLPEILTENGYETAAFIGNGNMSKVFGFGRGFKTFEELSGIYPRTLNITAKEINRRVFNYLKKYEKNEDRNPLFLLIWTMEPHDPYTPRDENKDMFDINRYQPVDTYQIDLMEDVRFGRVSLSPSKLEFVKTRYDQEIYENDIAFGQLLDTLKELNLFEDMEIIFTSDHGEQFFEHGGVKHGENVYDESVHIPFVIKSSWLEPGIHKERVQLSDICPTVLDMAGIPLNYNMDGLSLFSLRDVKRDIYFENYRGGNHINAVMGTGGKLIYNIEFRRPPRHPYIPLLEMYSLEDKKEQNSLALDEFSDFALLQRLIRYRNMGLRKDIQEEQADIPPELEEELKALGYIKRP